MNVVEALLRFVSAVAAVGCLVECPRVIRVETVDDSCFVARGHPLSPDRVRVTECRLEIVAKSANVAYLDVHGPLGSTYVGPRSAGEIARSIEEHRRSRTPIVWATVDGFSLAAAFVLAVMAFAPRRSRPREPGLDCVPDDALDLPAGEASARLLEAAADDRALRL